MSTCPPALQIGNVEGGDLLADKAEAIVSDGFTGNVALKSSKVDARLLVDLP